MKIALIQSNLFWENPVENRNYFENRINSITQRVDLILLPEMFSTGFTMNPKPFAESMNGETVLWLKKIAKLKKAAITGSLIIVEDNLFYNRLVFVYPCGKINFYNKRHLFSLAGEEKIYTKGDKKIIIEYLGWRICPLICYDLRFPVFSRNCEEYDVLLYVANWPKIRINAWDTLLKARAIENICYAIGVNRTGLDSKQLEYPGHSQVIDFLGNNLIFPKQGEGVFITSLDKDRMIATRQNLGFLNDRDDFNLT